ncbi:hypothetical protein [Pseudonocardia oroxyli]|uniref:hypothetical protein n=1 Tax=Pseudonocardia oroxyli TaxID=366584 RepID=UPI00115FAAC5|nr:hypothetical protein [Pseudonocardia oroxyli]
MGDADTGFDQNSPPPGATRLEHRASWLSRLGEADVEEARRLVSTTSSATFSQTPLAGLLSAIPAGQELLLVTTSAASGKLATGPLGRALAAALTRWPKVYGSEIATVRLVEVEGFNDEAVVGPLGSALAERRDLPVVLSMGSGSTGLQLAAMAAVVESGRRWEVRAVEPPHPRVALLPEQDSHPLVPWLIRLGFPERVRQWAQNHTVDPALVDYAKDLFHAHKRAVESSQPDAGDLSELVRSDLRRRDRSAGLSIRSWIIAEYERQRALDVQIDSETPNLLADLGRRSLGELFEDLEAADPSLFIVESARWLASKEVKNANTFAAQSVHLTAPSWEKLAPALFEESPGIPVPPEMPRFRVPGRRLAVVWAVGIARGGAWETYAETLSRRPLDGELVVQLGDGVAALHGVLVHTPESASNAKAQIDLLADKERWTGSAFAERVGTPLGVELPTDSDVAVRVSAELERIAPDAVIVVPTGPKSLTTSMLAGAFSYTTRTALPLFLECTDRRSEHPRYHRVLPMLGADDQLVALAEIALNRLEFDTAARLLALGSTSTRELVRPVRELGTAFYRRGGERAAVTLCRSRLRAVGQSGPGIAALRLTVIANEAAQKLWKHDETTPKAKRRMVQLKNVRNALTVTHGTQSLSQALKKFASIGGHAMKIDELVGGTLGGTPDDSLVRLHEDLVRRLQARLLAVGSLIRRAGELYSEEASP